MTGSHNQKGNIMNNESNEIVESAWGRASFPVEVTDAEVADGRATFTGRIDSITTNRNDRGVREVTRVMVDGATWSLHVDGHLGEPGASVTITVEVTS